MSTEEKQQLESAEAFDIAIVGMSGRFPGAKNVDELWTNFREGIESLSTFTDEELTASGIDPAIFNDPQYVRRRGVLSDAEMFDAGFFGVYPREAETMDPQHRLFLECAWEAVEDAGYCPDTYKGLIGVYGGVGMNSYLLNWLMSGGTNVAPAEGYQLVIGNDKDFVATRVSYKLNLRGPSVVVQTACSTSLVAVHMACQGLLGYQCDMALAGGVTVNLPQKAGYLYQEGMILSPDGRCRAFDAGAQGTVGGNGAGVVLLKRLADARADRDHIYAVIKATACNNDGSLRVGYTSPGVEGQASVIATAQELAGVHPETISYIEAHGTGTPLGDPIEIAALTQVFRTKTDRKGFCAIGSAKTNVGHLDAAAGVTGLIKTALALDHQEIPPSLHFTAPNPKIDFANSPFFVNAALREWPRQNRPRRAGVSSFGIGGTNVHAVLEEAPQVSGEPSKRHSHLLMVSAKTQTALDTATDNLVRYMEEYPETDLADLAYTLQVGRKHFNCRRIIVSNFLPDAAATLARRDPKRVFSFSHAQDPASPSVAFMFSGQGAQYAGMAKGLYETEPVFRKVVDECAEVLRSHLGRDIREVLFPKTGEETRADEVLSQTSITQPALFVIEYALSMLLIHRGIRPDAMVGHSIGEYVAACLAGVFSRDEALRLVAARGRLMQSMPKGSMLSLPLEENEVRDLLGESISLATVNGPGSCVVSGPPEAIEALQNSLQARGVDTRLLHTSHAFHSSMMDPILEDFRKEVSKAELNPPSIPYLSNVTGTWITESQATDPAYWATHLRKTVRFGDNAQALLEEGNRVLIEVGPGQTLSTLARRQKNAVGRVILSTIRHPQEAQADDIFLMTALGRLWLAGVRIDWESLYAGESRKRLRLPTYPFERQRYWLEQPRGRRRLQPAAGPAEKRADTADWLYVPSWKRQDLPRVSGSFPLQKGGKWLLFMDEGSLGTKLESLLKEAGQEVVKVFYVRERGANVGGVYTIDPGSREAYDWLAKNLAADRWFPTSVIHLWNIGGDSPSTPEEQFNLRQTLGFKSLIYLAQAMGRHFPAEPCQVAVVSTGLHEVLGEELLSPETALLNGPCRVIPQEFPHLILRSIDLPLHHNGEWDDRSARNIISEFLAPRSEVAVAYRSKHRWIQSYESLRREHNGTFPYSLCEGGVYMITGGLGRIGLVVAEYLARSVRAKLVLCDRSPFPARVAWEEWIATHPETDVVSGRMRKLMEMEGLGSNILVFQANVTNEEEMRRMVQEAEKRFGPLNGVFHGAGEVGSRTIRTILETGPENIDLQLQAKVYGTRVLARVLGDRKPDFVLLHSSLASVLGGLGFTAYSAANSFLDGFATSMSRASATRWISVNWDAWQDDMRSGNATVAPEEGVAVLDTILRTGVSPQVVVSATDLGERLRKWVNRVDGPEEAKEGEESRGESTVEDSSLHARPNMQTSYVAPATDLEREVVEVWQKLLGIGEVGTNDNFFELGGNSLIGTQLASQLRSRFHVEMPLRRLFEDPTVACVARIIEEERAQHGPEADKIAEALKRVQQLTEEEVKGKLGAEATDLLKQNG